MSQQRCLLLHFSETHRSVYEMLRSGMNFRVGDSPRTSSCRKGSTLISGTNWLALICVIGLLVGDTSVIGQDGVKEGGKAAGILIDKQDNWISVKGDGDEAPVKYVTGDPPDKNLAEVLKKLFTVSRVQLTYKMEGDARKLVSIKRHVPKSEGTVTGEVVKSYGWWVEVKLKTGVSDGYACNFPFDDNQNMMETLKELQPGDSVTIDFTTDFERHRIQKLRKNVVSDRKEMAKDSGKVSGILIDRHDTWITVKADGEREPVKYQVDPSDKRMKDAYKTVFNACRVQLTYKLVGDARQLVTMKRQILKESGTVTGEVVKVYNDFWVEVKPKKGLADAYAPGANYNDKEFMEKLKSLKPGDSVTIEYNTDFERHRITSLRKNPTP